MKILLLSVGIFAAACNLFVLLSGYRIMKLASFIPTWRKGWLCFLLAIVTITVGLCLPYRALFITLSSLPFSFFVYYMSQVFKGLTSLNEESRFITLVKNLPTGLVVYSPDATVVYVNKVAKEIMGVTDCNAEGMTEAQLHRKLHFIKETGEELPLEEHPVFEVLKTGCSFSDRVYGTAEGKWILCSAYSTNGTDSQVVVVFSDITNLKDAEASCDISREVCNHAFLNSHDAILVTDAEGKIYSINRMFSLFTGYGEDVVGKTTYDIGLWKDLKERAILLEALKSSGQVVDWNVVFTHKNGNALYGLLSATTLVNNKNKILASIKKRDKKEKSDE